MRHCLGRYSEMDVIAYWRYSKKSLEKSMRDLLGRNSLEKPMKRKYYKTNWEYLESNCFIDLLYTPKGLPTHILLKSILLHKLYGGWRDNSGPWILKAGYVYRPCSQLLQTPLSSIRVLSISIIAVIIVPIRVLLFSPRSQSLFGYELKGTTKL